jgi:hypothetical protein
MMMIDGLCCRESQAVCLIASFYLVDGGLRHRLPGNLSLGPEVSRRGSLGSDDNGHTTVVSLRADHWFAGLFDRNRPHPARSLLGDHKLEEPSRGFPTSLDCQLLFSRQGVVAPAAGNLDC